MSETSMGIIERAELDVRPGQMDALLAHLHDHVDALRGCPGCHSLSYGQGVESPGKALVLMHWESIEAHHQAREVPAFGAFVSPLLGMIAGTEVEHFDMRAWPGKGMADGR